MQQSAFGNGDGVCTLIDPFGIAASTLEVQQAWCRHPELLAEELRRLTEQWSALQFLAWQRCWGQAADDPVPAVVYDERFADPIWTEHPFYDLLKECYLAHTRWLENAIERTPAVPARSRHKALFWMRQALNAASPSNYFWTNPKAVYKAVSSCGSSLADGAHNLVRDWLRNDVSMVDDEPFEVGRNLANTPGQVVFRNGLLELIQYQATTKHVRQIPIVIVAPWINKFYILDLDEQKSLVRFLVSQGYTVFTTSWKNPDASMSATQFDDYMLQGVLEAVSAARSITGSPEVHAAGYCIGGTILAALMAWLNQGQKASEPAPIAHFTLLTSLIDFAAPGDIEVFIDDRSVSFLEQLMAWQGYLDGGAMAWSFRMLRSNSLIWHYVVQGYLCGEEPPSLDVLYWNTDSTRLPAAMHSYYLRQCYIENKLVQPGGLVLGGRAIDVRRIRQPLYAIGTEQDHIAPWKETFKTCALVQGPVRYVLATSGHIMGIISPPVNPPKRHYWVGDATGQSDPEGWRQDLEKKAGSWWEDWALWLGERCGPMVQPPTLGSERLPPLAPAPGTYVLEQ